jgi:hypothetical protein
MYVDTETDVRFMKYAIETGSGALIYVRVKFHKDWFRYSKFDVGRVKQTHK